ncbi:MAG TPA: 2OG-Fe dioxygenase family protein [Aliidongia sp.]|uniref:2OG-Fe dioxygenase family protein n=1 Tax=Aliidongia sp. TaxID=1914230 RepID=UPI002DDD8A44|nr:2OG-Fe dioxygenase family protein [Aliidongia sp.]HEV2675014.1 2OG-Fe dioxygenase family protein [Aliidongia sp.]
MDELLQPVGVGLKERGFAFVEAPTMAAILQRTGLTDWAAFADSWNDLGLDTYMADGGRYRRRRHAAFAMSDVGVIRKPHQPHYQSRDYNSLNGGLERWFEPIRPDVADHPAMNSILTSCFALFDGLTPRETKPAAWHVEVHQFRIEARSGVEGRPTPEGLHRDGVDWVLVLLVARDNIASGMTTIHDMDRRPLGSFTLTQPLDSALVDDGRVYHGVTPVEPLDPERPAYRDVLVVTFRR